MIIQLANLGEKKSSTLDMPSRNIKITVACLEKELENLKHKYKMLQVKTCHSKNNSSSNYNKTCLTLLIDIVRQLGASVPLLGDQI